MIQRTRRKILISTQVAAFLGEFCRLPLQKFAALEPCGAFGDRPRAEAIAAALRSHAFSEDLACLLTPFLVDTIVRTAPMPKHRHREAPLSPAVWKSNLRRVRPPRHRRDACSMAWRCRFLTARPSQDAPVIAEK